MRYATTGSRRRARLALIFSAAVTALGLALNAAPSASAAPSSGAARPAAAASSTGGPRSNAAAGSVAIGSLRATGARVDVTVRRIYSPGQARWVDHVVDEHLTSTEGCVADPSDSTRRGSTYRTHVNLFCSGGTAAARQAAADLRRSRPWYRMTVTPVPVVAFQFLADLDHGTGNAVGAALNQLPANDFMFADGDDVSLTYVGTGVTQSELDAARAAFARELRIPASRVAVSPVNWG